MLGFYRDSPVSKMKHQRIKSTGSLMRYARSVLGVGDATLTALEGDE